VKLAGSLLQQTCPDYLFVDWFVHVNIIPINRVLTDLENLENSGNLSTLEKSGKIQGILG